jgi:uncharacterized protein
MPRETASLDLIEDFLAQKRIAMVGVSRDAQSFSTKLFEEFCRRGYDMIPVNPLGKEVLGRKCYARVQDVTPAADAALLMTSAAATDTVVQDCAAAGIRRIWMYRAGGEGAVSDKAIAFCRAQGIQVVPGECPYMFLPHSGGIHGFHAWIKKIFGHYPRRAAA